MKDSGFLQVCSYSAGGVMLSIRQKLQPEYREGKVRDGFSDQVGHPGSLVHRLWEIRFGIILLWHTILAF